MKVVDRDGQTWRVTRRWTPWRWRLRKLDTAGDGWDLGGDDLLGAIVIGLIAAIVLPVVAVAVVAGVEFLLLLLLAPLVALARVALGRHWTVEARRGWTAWWEEPSGDWRASGRRIREVADEIERGRPPERTLVPRD